jgi:hypothetical protein
VVHPQIAAFARLAGENVPPVRTLEGQKTLISRTMHGFGYDPVHDEIVVTSPLTQTILIFRGGASGEEPPVRVIRGPHTQILGTPYGGNSEVTVDGVNGEIYLPIAPKSVLVFDREGSGDVAPKRRLDGVQGGALAVDPVHNLLIENHLDSMIIYDRTATGVAKPKAIIKGPKADVGNTMSFQVYPPKGWIVGGCGQAYASSLGVCAWSINDNGDVAPRWRLPVQKLTGYQPSGIALDPIHKEIFLSASGQKIEVSRPFSGIMNTAMTFSWPEIF